MTITGEARRKVKKLLQRDQKSEAVKYLCATLGISVKESLTLINALEEDTYPVRVAEASRIKTGRFKGQFKSVLFFGVLGCFFWCLGGITFYLKSASIANSDLVPGVVVNFKTSNKGKKAPIVNTH